MYYKNNNANNNAVVDNNTKSNIVTGNAVAGNNGTTEKNVVENEYIDVIKQTKKSNINKNNINEIMLSQIPCVSVNVSKIVMGKYKTIKIKVYGKLRFSYRSDNTPITR